MSFSGLFIAGLYSYGTGGLTLLAVYNIPLPQYNLILMPLWQIFLAYALIRFSMLDEAEIAVAVHKDKLMTLGTITASINHELKNPVYAIRSRAELTRRKLDEKIIRNHKEIAEELYGLVESCFKQTDRATRIISRLKSFSKQEQGVEEITSEANLYESLNYVLSLCELEFHRKSVRIENLIPKDVATIRCARQDLEQVLFNLILNAEQSANPGDTIQISAEQKKNKVSIKIKDDGPGIPDAKLKKIFEPFYTTKAQGTGLGLYITKMLVERNGGTVTVQSCVGKGTSFRMNMNLFVQEKSS